MGCLSLNATGTPNSPVYFSEAVKWFRKSSAWVSVTLQVKTLLFEPCSLTLNFFAMAYDCLYCFPHFHIRWCGCVKSLHWQRDGLCQLMKLFGGSFGFVFSHSSCRIPMLLIWKPGIRIRGHVVLWISTNKQQSSVERISFMTKITEMIDC